MLWLNGKLRLVFSWHHGTWQLRAPEQYQLHFLQQRHDVKGPVVCMFVGVLWTCERPHMPEIYIPASLRQVQRPSKQESSGWHGLQTGICTYLACAVLLKHLQVHP